jgi:hypothetical protein
MSKRKTHCSKGHSFSEHGIYNRSNKPNQRVCKLCLSAYRSKWLKERVKKDPLYSRKHHLKSRYGLTQEKFEELFKRQNNRCAICFTDTPDSKGFVVDHCHNTGALRSILCNQCNTGLGLFKDNKLILNNALNYLEKWSDVVDK